ncbi:MAG: OmpA family protein [Elusimicrobia bacterium]|nr:OmpA family protein [Elusimicrobiota bacterium]
MAVVLAVLVFSGGCFAGRRPRVLSQAQGMLEEAEVLGARRIAPGRYGRARKNYEQAVRVWEVHRDRAMSEIYGFIALEEARVARDLARGRSDSLAQPDAAPRGTVSPSELLRVFREIYKGSGERASFEMAFLPQMQNFGLLLSLVGDVYFESGQARFQERERPKLSYLAELLKRYPGHNLLIMAHTDAQGGDAYNLRLSEQRAESVKEILVGFGVDAGRIAVRGYGEERPLANNRTARGRAQNRRVEILILQP